MAQQKKYAHHQHPSIAAALTGLYRFKTAEQAQARLDVIRKGFVLSKAQQPTEMPSVTLWVRGYGITPEEEGQGFRGHFACIRLVPFEKGFTLAAEKLARPLSEHPQKEWRGRSMPNWSHPVLRRLQKKAPSFPTFEEAQALLQQLHSDFPETTIPGEGRLYAMLYRRVGKDSPPGARPVEKYVFEVASTPEGTFTIKWKVNEPKKPRTSTKVVLADDANKGAAANGFFTAMITAKRRKKKPAGRVVVIRKQDEENQEP
jgi:hypothetical protein